MATGLTIFLKCIAYVGWIAFTIFAYVEGIAFILMKRIFFH